jgi:UDP-N-acetylmuramate dehydrogenase
MSLEEVISEIAGCTFYKDHDLTSFTTMRLDCIGDFVEVKSIDALCALLPILASAKRSFIILGWGANQIFPKRISELVVHLDFDFSLTYFDNVRSEYVLPASIGLNYLTAHAIKHGLKGWEVITGIPASLGGAIYMNAGTNLGEIGSLVKSVQIVTSEGKCREEMISEKSFSYRKNHFLKPGEVIVGATLIHHGQAPSVSVQIKEYMEYRKRTQPLATRNCGCVFKNPSKTLQAGRLIDLIGFKGMSVGGLQVSTKHANFIENSGRAEWDQFEALVQIIKTLMDRYYGIEFELEVKIPYD